MADANITVQITELPPQYSYERQVAQPVYDDVIKQSALAPSPPPTAPLAENAASKRDHIAPPLPPFLNAIDLFRRNYIAPFSAPPFASLPDMGLGELILYLIWFGANAVVVIVLVVQFATADSVTSEQSAASTLGTIGSIDLVFILFPIAQNSIWLYIFGVSFERAVKYHIWMALTAIFVLTLHGILMWISYALHTEPNDGYGGGGSWSSQAFDGALELNGSGFGSMAALLIIGAMAIEPIRRYCWQIFIRTHVILFIAFLVFATAHATLIAYFIPALFLWAIDIYCRYRSASAKAQLVSIKLLPSGEMSIEFIKENFKYKAGQWVYLCVPAIDPTQWHPFSLSSSPHQSRLFLHARVLGDWTRLLLKYTEEKTSVLPNIYIDGPYGTTSFPVENYNHIVLIAGGIGVTPLQSLLNELLYIHSTNDTKQYNNNNNNNNTLLSLKHLYFHWSIRDTRMVTSLNNALFDNIQREGVGIIPSILDMRIYVTKSQIIDNNTINNAINNSNNNNNDNNNNEINDINHFNKFIINERMNVNMIIQNIKKSILHTPIIHEENGIVSKTITESKTVDEQVLSSQTIQQAGDDNIPDTTSSSSGGGTGGGGSGPTRILVFCCGPASLMRDVQHVCALVSDKQVYFDVHTETFEL